MSAAIAEVPRKKSDVETRHAASPPTLYAPSPSTVYEIPVDLIVRSETNRQPELDDDFVESISRGVDTPVLVRPIKATFEQFANQPGSLTGSFGIGQTIYKLVYGERRWAASKKAGNKTIPAIVRELTETQALEIQVRENEHRKDYNALDRAAAYAHLRAQYMKDHHGEKGFTEEKCCALIAETCKNDKIKGRTVQQIIALGKLSRECQEALRKGEMEQSHAYEFSRLSVQDQAELLLWLRQQTHHSQGDIPSVRRLKLEIRNIEQQREAEKRQPLFQETEKKESVAGAKLTFDGKTIELAPGQLPGSVRTPLLRIYPDLNTAFFLKDGRIQLSLGLTGTPFYMGVAELQKLLSAKALHLPAAPAQTLAAKEPDWINKKAPVIQQPKPLSQKQIKKFAEEQAKQNEQRLKAERERERNERIDKKHRGLMFAAFASKAKINSRFLSHAVPDMVFSSLDGNTYDEFEIDAEFGQRALAWPAPSDGNAYSVEEICSHAKKHTRKFTQGLLAAVILTIHMTPAVSQQLAKYFGVDAKKLRKKAAAEVEAERLRVPEPKTPKDKVLFTALKGREKDWAKLRKSGATDKQIRELLCHIFGEYGGHGAPGMPWIHFRGTANNPRVWFKISDTGTPDLAGAELVTKVRELLNIQEIG